MPTFYSVRNRLRRHSAIAVSSSVQPVGYRHPVPSGTDDPWSPALNCVTPDDVELAVYDFGGTGDDLLLVHGAARAWIATLSVSADGLVLTSDRTKQLRLKPA